jgi:hypothetical protein
VPVPEYWDPLTAPQEAPEQAGSRTVGGAVTVTVAVAVTLPPGPVAVSV